MVELRNKKSGGPFTKEDEEVGMEKNNYKSVNPYILGIEFVFTIYDNLF